MNKEKILALIPARSGSKGLPGKNIKLLGGIPLIAHTIVCAQKSRLFDEVHVSTDSEEYADIAKKYKASVKFLRPAELSSDNTSVTDVLRYVINTYKQQDRIFSSSFILQPTSPLRISEDIISAYSLFCIKNANTVVSICETDHSPLWCNRILDDHSLYRFIPDTIRERQRQELDTYYRINGAIYIIRNKYILDSSDLYGENSYAYIMPKERSVDIDDEIDFVIAEALLKWKKFL